MLNVRRKQLHISRILIMVMLLATLTVAPVLAATSNLAYEVVSYDLHGIVGKDHSCQVEEKITVNLPENLDSISFVIPNGNYRLYGLTVENVEYKRTRDEAENAVSIIDADKLTEGRHTYTIGYTIREFDDRDEEKDMFYFNALLPSWPQPIGKLSISMEFPDDFPWTDMQYYAGQYGVQDVDTKLDYKADSVDKTVTITGERIPENFGITIKDQLPNGYWEGALDGSWAVNIINIVMLALMLLFFLMWLIGGRDPKVKKVAQTHPVEGITPAEIGYIFSTRVRTRDIISLIVYFGIRGYLKISEYEPKRYRLIRKEDPKQEEKFVRNAYDIIFEDIPKKRWVEMDMLGERLARVKASISEDVAAGFSSKEMNAYTSLSRAFRIISGALLSIVMGVAVLLKYSYMYMTPNYFEAGIVVCISAILIAMMCRQVDRQIYSEDSTFTITIIGLSIIYFAVATHVAVSTFLLTGQIIAPAVELIGSLVCLFLITIMRARAKGNAVLAGRFRQLRHFIYDPDPSELIKNVAEDPGYYYEMVPYALYFNALEAWALKFIRHQPEEPDWISDDIEGHAFRNIKGQSNVIDYAKDISAFARTVESSYRSMMRRRRK